MEGAGPEDAEEAAEAQKRVQSVAEARADTRTDTPLPPPDIRCLALTANRPPFSSASGSVRPGGRAGRGGPRVRVRRPDGHAPGLLRDQGEAARRRRGRWVETHPPTRRTPTRNPSRPPACGCFDLGSGVRSCSILPRRDAPLRRAPVQPVRLRRARPPARPLRRSAGAPPTAPPLPPPRLLAASLPTATAAAQHPTRRSLPPPGHAGPGLPRVPPRPRRRARLLARPRPRPGPPAPLRAPPRRPRLRRPPHGRGLRRDRQARRTVTPLFPPPSPLLPSLLRRTPTLTPTHVPAPPRTNAQPSQPTTHPFPQVRARPVPRRRLGGLPRGAEGVLPAVSRRRLQRRRPGGAQGGGAAARGGARGGARRRVRCGVCVCGWDGWISGRSVRPCPRVSADRTPRVAAAVLFCSSAGRTTRRRRWRRWSAEGSAGRWTPAPTAPSARRSSRRPSGRSSAASTRRPSPACAFAWRPAQRVAPTPTAALVPWLRPAA